MKQRIWILAAAAIVAFSLPAAEWFVDRTRPDDSGNGKSEEAAKRTIQAAVSAASAGDVVTVLPGVYDEGGNTFTASSVVSSNRVYILKNLTLRSRDGAAVTHIVGAKDLNVATNASPWGMGPGAIRCIAVATGVTNVKIEGFTIRDGATAFGSDSAPVRGAGVLNVQAQPGVTAAGYIVVRDCVIRDNTGTRGGGIYGVTAVNCTFTGNRASNFGAAARECCLEGCVLYRNSTLGSAGVGVMAYGYSAVNCTFAYNDTVNAFSNIDGSSARFASNCVAVANGGCGIEQNIYTCITDVSGKPNGCIYVNESTSRIFVAPAAGDFRLRAESEAVTQNPLADGYCGAVQEAVSCEGSGYLSFSTASGGTMSVDRTPTPRLGRAPTPSRSRRTPARELSATSMRVFPAGPRRTRSITCCRPPREAQRSYLLSVMCGTSRQAATTRPPVRRRRPGGRSRARWTALRETQSPTRSCMPTPAATTRAVPSCTERPTAWCSPRRRTCA